MPNLPQEHDVPESFILYSTRYVLGRSSYAVGDMIDWLRAHWTDLSTNTQRTIQSDIQRRLRADDLGHEMDVQNWQKVLTLEVTSDE